MTNGIVLVVDDDPASCETLADILEIQGYTVLSAGTGGAAEALIRSTAVDAVLLDLRLPDLDGMEVLRRLKAHSPDTEVLMVSGYATLASAIEAMRHGAFGYVQKPVNVEEVLGGLQRALERQRLARELRSAHTVILERVQELEFLLDTVRVVSTSLEVSEALQLLAKEIVDRLRVTLCHIAVLGDDRLALETRATYPVRRLAWEPDQEARISLADSPTYRRVVEGREAVLLRADQPDPPWPADGVLGQAPEAGSALLVPMLVKGRVMGVVSVLEARQWARSPFTQDKINLCSAMASGAAIAIENALLFEERERAHLATLAALAAALDARERETRAHSARVQEYALTLAREVGLDGSQLKAMAAGGLLHDIGKIGVRDSILLKPGPLTEEEWAEMRQHPRVGAEILARLTHLEGAREVVLCHQERWDGTGYPSGLAGAAIPLGARIFAVVDTLDAITSDRPYRPRRGFDVAREEIARCAGSQFDPEVVAAFLRVPLEVWEEIRAQAQPGG